MARVPSRRRPEEAGPSPRRGPWMRLAIAIVRPSSLLLTKRVWSGGHNVPLAGGVIIAANHISWADPFTLAHFVYDAGRIPRFMAKESLFRVPVTGWILRGANQIPVHRGERDGAAALSDAVMALRNGEAVLIYPEGTITRDPDYWPMQAKTGVARLSLMSGAPIIPVAQWGAQEILGASRRLRLFPRRTVVTHALPPIVPKALSASGQPNREELRALTAEVMFCIREGLSAIRQAPAPQAIWDPRREERIAPAGADTADQPANPSREGAA